MKDELVRISAIVVHVTMLVVVLIGLKRIRKLNEIQREFFWLVFIAILIELIGRVLWNRNTNNLFLYHFYTPIEFVLLASIYKRHLDSLIRPVYLQVLMWSFVLFAIINALFFQGLKEFNSHVTFVECLLLIALAFTYFYVMLRDLKYRKLEHNPMFWINVSVLTYFSGALVLFHLANELIPESMAIRGLVWGVHAIFNIVHYLLFGIALWVRPEITHESNLNQSEN